MLATLRQQEATQPQAVAVFGAAVRGGRRHHAYVLACAELEPAALLARAVAAALVCEAPSEGDACGVCPGCKKLEAGTHPDVLSLAPGEKGSIAIEQVREVVARLGLHATLSKTKVVIVTRADAMTPQAQNAILKTLEEPPGPTCFLLMVTRPRTLLPTIRSRCQLVRLAPADRLAAWRSLAAGGLDEQLAKDLGPIVGPDLERARAAAETAEECGKKLWEALAPEADAARLGEIAAELSADKDSAELTLALLEVAVRDALARRHRADDGLLYAGDRHLAGDALTVAAGRLQELRRLGVYNLNRTLAVETMLLALRGLVR